MIWIAFINQQKPDLKTKYKIKENKIELDKVLFDWVIQNKREERVNEHKKDIIR